MNWIMKLLGWKKEESFQGDPQTPESPEILDDWVTVSGEWFEGHACPCGCFASEFKARAVCPKCGHRLEVQTVCWEWQESPSREAAIRSLARDLLDRSFFYGVATVSDFEASAAQELGFHYVKDKHLLFWTPEHCKKGEA